MQLGCERRRTASETGELESSRKAFTSARASQSARTIGTWPAAARRHGGITAPAGAHSPCPHWLRGRSGRSRQAVRTERLCCGLRATVARAIPKPKPCPDTLSLREVAQQRPVRAPLARWRGESPVRMRKSTAHFARSSASTTPSKPAVALRIPLAARVCKHSLAHRGGDHKARTRAIGSVCCAQ